MSPKTTPRPATISAVLPTERFASAFMVASLCGLSEQHFGDAQIERGRHLEVLRRTRMDQDAPAATLHQHRVVGGVSEGTRARQGLPQRPGPEGLRGLDRPEPGAVEGALHLSSLRGLLDRVG